MYLFNRPVRDLQNIPQAYHLHVIMQILTSKNMADIMDPKLKNKKLTF